MMRCLQRVKIIAIRAIPSCIAVKMNRGGFTAGLGISVMSLERFVVVGGELMRVDLHE